MSFSRLKTFENDHLFAQNPRHQRSCNPCIDPKKLSKKMKRTNNISNAQKASTKHKPFPRQPKKKSLKSTRDFRKTSTNLSISRRDPHTHKVPENVKPSKKHSINQIVKMKTKDFRVLARCLLQYVRNEEDVRAQEVIKMVMAFNKSEIATFSKPLEVLIDEIIEVIQQIMPDQEQRLKPIFTKMADGNHTFKPNCHDERPNKVEQPTIKKCPKYNEPLNLQHSKPQHHSHNQKRQNRYQHGVVIDQSIGHKQEGRRTHTHTHTQGVGWYEKRDRDYGMNKSLQQIQKARVMQQLHQIVREQQDIIDRLNEEQYA